MSKLDYNIAMELVRVTESAALSAAAFIGTGDKNGGDKAAVDGMRESLRYIDVHGTIIISEGEAVDPVEGTNLLALGRPNAIATIAASDQGSMWDPGSSFYMNKLVVGEKAKNAIDITKSVTENLNRIAEAEGKKVNDLMVYILDKPRHKAMIEEIRKAGARITLHTDGDVLGALLAAMPDTGVDVLMGIGGTPEGVLAACAVKALNGGMQGMRAPQLESEIANLKKENIDISEVIHLDTLIKSENAVFSATGITSGGYLDGVKFHENGTITTKSVVISAKSGSIRFIEGIHKGINH